MAKLENVKYPNEVVEINGTQYRKVDRRAQAGDVVRITDEDVPSYVTSGAFYEVKRIDSFGDPQIIDDDGDEWDTCGDDYEVYQKVTEPTAPQYREVVRKAVIGDKIRVLNVHNPEKFSVGDVLTVTSVDGAGDILRTEPTDSAGLIFYSHREYGREYVVLEPVSEAEAALQPKRLTIGDYAKVIGPNDNLNDYEIGSIVEIAECYPDTYRHVVYRAKKADGTVGNYIRDYQLVRVSRAEFEAQKRLAVGDYAKVVNPRSQREDKRGHIVEIIRDDRDCQPFRARSLANGKSHWYFEEELVRATESEVAAAKQAAEKAKKVGEFADGGYAVVVKANSENSTPTPQRHNGAYVQVRTQDRGSFALKITLADGDYGYCNADALRKVTREEYEEATKPAFSVGDTVKLTIAKGERPRHGWGCVSNGDIGKVVGVSGERISVDFPTQKSWTANVSELTLFTEEAKWAAIGRKVNEFKVGDLTMLPTCAELGFAEVVRIDDDDRIVVKWASKLSYPECNDKAKSHKLVVPVEQRFDRAEGGASPSK